MNKDVLVGSSMQVSKEMFDEELSDIKSLLTSYNPFDPDSVFYGFIVTDDFVLFPRGITASNQKLFKDYKDITVSSSCDFETKPNFKLRDYQEIAEEDILEYIDNTSDTRMLNILLTASTGSGKTYMLSSVLSKLKQKVLFLSHLSMLSEQVTEELKMNTTASVEIISNATVEFPDISVATFQLLNMNPELLERVANSISIVVIDETENVVSATRLAVLFKLKAKIAIFVSATPTRELMKRTGIINSLVNHQVSMDSETIPIAYAMIDFRHLVWTSPMMKEHYKRDLWKFLKDTRIIDDVVALTTELVNYEGTVWIIASLGKIHTYLENKFTKLGIPCKSIQGVTSKAARYKILSGITEGTVKVVIASAPISAGISIPQISSAIRLEPHSSSDELLVQQEGRLKRTCEFKETQIPIWFDIAVSGSLAGKGKQRFKRYTSKGGCRILDKEKLAGFIKETWGK